MKVKLLTDYHLEFLSLKEAAQVCPGLHLSKCQIVGNYVSPLFSHFSSGGHFFSGVEPFVYFI